MFLSDKQIRTQKPSTKIVKLFDGGGLFLQVMPSGGRWWRFRYRFNGVEKQLSFGVYPDVPLKRAREKRDDARRLVADGIDPAAKRREQRRANACTFEAVALEWLEQRAGTWSEE